MSAPRVASLIPSGTEIVAALGMADCLVGRSHCCDHPAEVVDLPVLSRPRVDPSLPGAEIDRQLREVLSAERSAYEILMEPLLAAAPEVLVTQDHCDACAVSLSDVRAAVACPELSAARLCPLHPHDLDAVREDFRRVAAALGVPERGERLAARFDERLRSLDAATRSVGARPRVLLLEWIDPPMVAGGWIPQLARLAGLEPLVVTDASSFEQVDWADLERAGADAMVVLPCGFGVERSLRELREGPAGRRLRRLSRGLSAGCWVVDGDAYFNRPGPRLVESAELLAEIFHGRAHGGADAPGAPATRFARLA